MNKRIVAIDVLRGFALMGILLMNMSSFAMPSWAYSNPVAYGGDDIWNRLAFSFSHIFADQKMMALFSMLFGASVILVTRNMEKKGQSSFKFHYLRNFWLLIIGLLHSVLVWDGDILMIYAICSFVLYLLRKLSAKWQFGLGLFIFFVPAFYNVWANSALPSLQTADLQSLEVAWQPTDADIAEEITYYQGDYGNQVAWRLGTADSGTDNTYTDGQAILDLGQTLEFFLRAFGMMLIGMAYYNWGVLTAKRSDDFYWKLAAVGFGLGLPLVLIGLFQFTANGWSATHSLFVGRNWNHLATPFIASGYIALVMLWSRSEFLNGLRDRLAAAGRMALTNYIGQSILGTFIFYGFGLGLFGSASRIQQWFFILLIWTIQLLFSKWWLSRYQYGPLEWLWRMLSRLQWQPLKKRVAISAG
ncbi:MAG: DUF418 domain-containing protein [Chloroflexota bacterium]